MLRLFWGLFKFVGWIIAIIGIIGLIVSICTFNWIAGIVSFFVAGIGGMMLNKVKEVKINRISKSSKNINFMTREEIAAAYKISLSDKDDKKKFKDQIEQMERSGQIIRLYLSGKEVYLDKTLGYEYSLAIKKAINGNGRLSLGELSALLKLPEAAVAGLVTRFNDGSISKAESNNSILYLSSKELQRILEEMEMKVRRSLEKMGGGDAKQIITATKMTAMEAGLLAELLESMRLNGVVEVVEFEGKNPLYKINSGNESGFTNLSRSNVEINLD